MRLYVWENVRTVDYYPGLLVVLASSEDEARALAAKEYDLGFDQIPDDPLVRELNEPFAVFQSGGS